MSHWPGHIKLSIPDNGLNVTSSTTTNGSNATKGTSTDAVVTVQVSNAGATGAAGTWSFQLQGSNVTNSGFTNVSPDKGSFANLTASGTSGPAHFQNLQYAYYRMVYTTSGASVTGMGTTIFALMPTADSFDASVQ